MLCTLIMDIYNSEYKLTASNLNYSLIQPWALSQTLPNGFFYVYKEVGDNDLYGIIDHQGKVVVELQFPRGIKYCTYDTLAKFEWNIF